MSGELVGEPADLPPAHGVGLPRQRERPHARTADATRREVAIDDRIDLVGSSRGLIDTLRIEGDDMRGLRKQCVEFLDPHGIEPGEFRDRANGGC